MARVTREELVKIHERQVETIHQLHNERRSMEAEIERLKESRTRLDREFQWTKQLCSQLAEAVTMHARSR